MTPFGGFLYFALVAYVVVPVLVARAFDVSPRRFILPATLAVIVLQFGLGPDGFAVEPVRAIGKVLVFAVAQLSVATVFLRIRTGGKRRVAFYAAAAIATLPLIIAKAPEASTAALVGFVGISYLTFRSLDVVFGIEDGLVKSLPAVEYLSYLLFFPAISAGPIDRYRRFDPDYRAPRSRDALLLDLDRGAQRFFRGLLYAFVVARLIDHYWLTRAASAPGVLGTVSYMYAYSLHLFFDFAGYSAFAIGTGHLLGVRMPENFDRPFLARNIQDFWNRWHITLSTWLRDHVYGRFVLSAMRGKWFADPTVAGHIGIALSFTVMGFWHGLAARYICYGLYHALLMVSYSILSTRSRKRGGSKLPPLAARFITFHLVCFGFLIFSGRLF